MDRISYECAKKVNGIIAYRILCYCKDVKVWRYPESNSGGHGVAPFIDGMNDDDNPCDKYDDTVIAPNWEELRLCLNSLNPSWYVLSEFEAIDDIDEFAQKLKEYMVDKENADAKFLFGRKSDS